MRHSTQVCLKNYPSAKIAVLYQNDDFGRDYVRVFKDALGHALDKMIVTRESKFVTERTSAVQATALRSKATDSDYESAYKQRHQRS